MAVLLRVALFACLCYLAAPQNTGNNLGLLALLAALNNQTVIISQTQGNNCPWRQLNITEQEYNDLIAANQLLLAEAEQAEEEIQREEELSDESADSSQFVPPQARRRRQAPVPPPLLDLLYGPGTTQRLVNIARNVLLQPIAFLNASISTVGRPSYNNVVAPGVEDEID